MQHRTTMIKVLLVSVVLREVLGGQVLENVLNFISAKPRSIEIAEERTTEAQKLINGFGYPFQEHNVTSEDGYIIKLHRIPHNNKIKYKDKGKTGNKFWENGISDFEKSYVEKNIKDKPAVVFHHGLLAASDTWLFRGPKKDLMYSLSDAGYDVWIINARGNVYSRNHTTLNPDLDADYWKFSFHEMGLYDLAATIDHVLNVTKQKKVYFIGHSMGATTAFVLCSLRPEYNEKIKLISGLAPTALIVHKLKPTFKLAMKIMPGFFKTLIKNNLSEFLPRRELTRDLLKFFCNDKATLQKLCLSLVFMFVGTKNDQFNTTLIPTISKYYPSGTSLGNMIHFYQLYTSGAYMPMDFGIEENLVRYKSVFPNPYNLTKITAPVTLHYGDGDFLVTKEDVVMLSEILPNVVGIYNVPNKKFNHMDFMWSIDSKKLIYDPLIEIMNKFR